LASPGLISVGGHVALALGDVSISLGEMPALLVIPRRRMKSAPTRDHARPAVWRPTSHSATLGHYWDIKGTPGCVLQLAGSMRRNTGFLRFAL